MSLVCLSSSYGYDFTLPTKGSVGMYGQAYTLVKTENKWDIGNVGYWKRFISACLCKTGHLTACVKLKSFLTLLNVTSSGN